MLQSILDVMFVTVAAASVGTITYSWQRYSKRVVQIRAKLKEIEDG